MNVRTSELHALTRLTLFDHCTLLIRNVMELYRVAADGGIADAMNSLGLLLEDGRGTYLRCSTKDSYE
jgi:TPR repeat protein